MKARNIFITLFFLFTMNVYATNVTVVLENKSRPLRAKNLQFNVDKSGLGRAWLTVDVIYNDFDSYLYQTVRTKFPGLRHNIDTNEVLLNNTVCAYTQKVLRRRLFRKPIEVIEVKSTGDCEFETFFYRKLTTIDDGYDVYDEMRFILDVKTI